MRTWYAAAMAGAFLIQGMNAYAADIVIRMGNGGSPPHPSVKMGYLYEQLVEERTGGKVDIQFYHSRQLGDDVQLLEGVLDGTIDSSISSTITMAQVLKMNNFAALQLPFLISNYDSLAKVFLSSAGQDLLDSVEAVGLKGLSLGEAGQRHFLSSKGPVQKFDDFGGLKVRIVPVPLFKSTWDAAGTSPVGIAYGEIYTSLQTHVIDALEINVSTVNAENLWETAKDFTRTGHYFWPLVMLFNKEKFDALPEDVQQVLIDVGREIIGTQVMIAKGDEQAQMAELEAKGVKFHEFQDLAVMRERMKPIVDEWAAKDPEIAKFIATAQAIDALGSGFD